MKYLICFFFSIFLINAIAQSPSDSLFNKLNSANDNEKVDIYLAIAKQNWRLSTDSIYKYSKLALDLSIETKYSNGEAKALSYIGVTFFYKAEYDSVFYYYDSAIEKFKESNDMSGVAIAINNKGVLYKRMGDYHQAIECYNQAKKIHEKNQDHREIGGALLNIGNVYDAQNDFDKAMEYYFQALEQFEQINDKVKIAGAYTNIGQIYSDLKQDLKALEFYEKAFTLQEESDDLYGMANSLSNIGLVHKSLGNYSESEKHFNESLELYKKMQDQDAIAWVYNNLGVVYSLMKQWEKAQLMYEKTVVITENIGDKESLGFVKYDLAEMYFIKKDWAAARKSLREGIALGRSLNMIGFLEKSYLLLSRLDSAQGSFRKSLENYKLYSQFKDSIFNEESSKQIAEMQTKYETSKKEQQIHTLKQEKIVRELKIRNNMILGTSGLLVLIISFGFLFILYRSKQRKHEATILLKNTMETEDKERKYFAEELHDGIGPLLSTVKMYVNELDDENLNPPTKDLLDESNKIIDEVICSARNLSHNLMPQNIDKDGLVKSLQVFSKRVCVGGKQNVIVNSQELSNYGKWQQVMIYRILTELINNSIKHSPDSEVVIKLVETDSSLKVLYEEKGAGFDVEKVLENSTGLGLQNIISRVKSLNGIVSFKTVKDIGFIAKIDFELKNLYDIKLN